MSLVAKLEGGEPQDVEVKAAGDGRYRVRIGGEEILVEAQPIGDGRSLLRIDGRNYQVGHTPWELGVDVELDGRRHRVDIGDPRRRALSGKGAGATGPQIITSPMPGKVIRVLVEPGQSVAEGDGLVVVEAMKMENEYRAPSAGVIEAVFVEANQTLDAGAKMVRFAPAEPS